MCNNDKDCNCICEILKVIVALQQNSCPDSCLESCDRPILGGGGACPICNTRPVILYTCCNGSTPIEMPTTRDITADPTGEITTSRVFRVEKIEGNCATFRVLVDNPDTTSIYPFVSTNSLFTMNLDCVCQIKCLTDTYIECV